MDIHFSASVLSNEEGFCSVAAGRCPQCCRCGNHIRIQKHSCSKPQQGFQRASCDGTEKLKLCVSVSVFW